MRAPRALSSARRAGSSVAGACASTTGRPSTCPSTRSSATRAAGASAARSLSAVAFRRDRLTWLAYALLAWFAYLQAAPGLVVPHLRDELQIGYTTGGLHVAAFATGTVVAGVTASALERGRGRRATLWGSALVFAVGTTGLTLGRVPAATIGSLLVAGWGGGTLLITVQALLADHHARWRAVALTEANVAASFAYVALVGGLS